MNYIDNIQSSTYTQFVSDQHDHGIEQTGRKTYIFLLDKKDTELSKVYKEEKHGRIYLPYFEQRAIYKTNTFISQLSVENYTEKEENLELEYNFGRMVHNIHELKVNSSGKFIIKNVSKIPLFIDITNEKFIIRNHAVELYSKELKGSAYKFVNELKKETSLIEIEYNGDSEEMTFIDTMSLKILPRRTVELDLNNSTYKNAEDVINRGSVIVTDKYRAYEVVGAYPRDDIYGTYVSWKVQLSLINLAKLDGLPDEFVEFIKKHQYGLFPHTKF